MAAQFLQREICQYCSKPGADHYNSPVTPLIYTDPTESQRLKPVNILWVPATLGHDTLIQSHRSSPSVEVWLCEQ